MRSSRRPYEDWGRRAPGGGWWWLEGALPYLLDEPQEVRVVLARVPRVEQARDAGPVRPADHEQVLAVEAHDPEGVHQLDVGEPLPVRGDLVLALDDEDAVRAQDAKGLLAGLEIQVDNGVVVFRPIGA